jgi:hypothetical protein
MFLAFYLVSKFFKNWVPTIKNMPAIEAINEAVGRATEMDAVVFFSPGQYYLTTTYAPQIIAGLSTLSYIASLTATRGTRLHTILSQPELIPQTTEMLREQYAIANAPEDFSEDMIEFLPKYWAWAAGIMSYLAREDIAANILIGPFSGEQISFLEVGARKGAIQIGGTARIVQIPVFALACDYFLIGEEIFALGAVLSEEPEQLQTIAIGDLIKVIAISTILLGVSFLLVNSNIIINVLEW